MKRMLAALAVISALAAGMAVREVGGRQKATAEEIDRDAISQRMPEMDGKNLTATLVEVIYPPGIGSERHLHPCPVIGYVAEGTIESQVKGQPLGTFTAGQTFYEPPNGVHVVSRNPSKTKPAKLLAYFLCDHAGPLSGPAPGAGTGQGK
jgi:quercetin dioxygenase-like cupin family protein